MKQLTDEDELKGKVISRAEIYDNKLFIFLEEDEFMYVNASSDYDGGFDIEVSTPFDFEPNSRNYGDLHELGFISTIEAKEWQDKNRIEYEEKQRANDLYKLAELKKKYETN